MLVRWGRNFGPNSGGQVSRTHHPELSMSISTSLYHSHNHGWKVGGGGTSGGADADPLPFLLPPFPVSR